MVCVYVPRISCYFATPQHGDRWKITQNSRGNASSIMVDFPLPCFFGWYASSKILVGHLGNLVSFCVVCLLPTQKQAKTPGKTTPWKSFGAKPTVLHKRKGKLYQFLNFLAVKQLTTGSQPKRSSVLFVQVLMFCFPRSRSVFWDFRNSFRSNPSEFGCLDFRLLHLSLQTFLTDDLERLQQMSNGCKILTALYRLPLRSNMKTHQNTVKTFESSWCSFKFLMVGYVTPPEN